MSRSRLRQVENEIRYREGGRGKRPYFYACFKGTTLKQLRSEEFRLNVQLGRVIHV